MEKKLLSITIFIQYLLLLFSCSSREKGLPKNFVYVKKYIRKREILVFLVCFFTFFLSCIDKVNDEKIVDIQKKDTLNIDVTEIKKNIYK